VSTTLLVDGHVHCHACFEVGTFLAAAARNFEAAKREMGHSEAVGCLMLTENSWNHYFRAFAEGLIERETREWRVQETTESCSLFATNPAGARLLIIAGRQVVAADRLEVLALATTREFSDGLPFQEALEKVVESGAVPVVPWGFGKWTGARGRIVRALLSSPEADTLCLGDNGGRPAHAPTPSLFRVALERGVPILPGSDPLPLPAEVRKPGRYGFVLQGPIDAEAPASSVRSLLATRAQPRRFGRLESPWTFVLRQTQLRLRDAGREHARSAVGVEATLS
jgi:hypothetical protein